VTRAGAALCVTALCAVLVWHVLVKMTMTTIGAITVVYTVTVTSYVVSRFVLSTLYRPPRYAGLRPPVAIVVPAFNEGAAVQRTIDALMALDYPQELLEIVVVNDGSTDDTWEHMTRAAGHYASGRVRCIDLGSNQGKRAAMAAGIRATTAEILVFVDSDSVPAPDGVRRLVQGFADPRVGAISGLSHVRNATTNALTRMQAARYYVSFQLLKAAESAVGAVACCSGCFAAYRRVAVVDLLDRWEHQRFLGTECTYGDDRALTNRVIRAGWRSIYDRRAEAWTDAPSDYKVFFRQQLRWKKSWSREGLLLLAHLWRTRPLAFPFALVATIAGLLSPVVLLANLIGGPVLSDQLPLLYVVGLYLIAMAYGLFHRSRRAGGQWVWAVVGTFFYIGFSPQLLWAIARLRDGSWGTRRA
jgi:hyaluronan synthase